MFCKNQIIFAQALDKSKEEREMAAIDLYKRKVLTLKDAESLYEDTLEAMGLDESETELDIYEQIKDRLDSRLFCDFPAR